MIEVAWVRDTGDLTVSELRNSAGGEGSAALKNPFGRSLSGAMDELFSGRSMEGSEALEAAGLRE